MIRCLRLRLPILAAVALGATRALAQDEPGIAVRGLVDARLVLPSSSVSALDAGLGKTRYGGKQEGGSRNALFRLAGAAAVIDARASEAISFRAHVEADLEPRSARTSTRLGLVEAFARFEPRLSPTAKLDLRLGIFFPPFSLENTGLAWTSPFTLTSSTASSWIGEEVRATGLETALVLSGTRSDLRIVGAVVGNSDPAGSVLAWRGFVLQDRLTTTEGRLPLPRVASLAPGGVFAQQSPFVTPHREIDGRLGGYAGLVYSHTDVLEVRVFGFANRGLETEFDGAQYAWRTEFLSGAAKARLSRLEILVQGLHGTSGMGPGDLVSIRFTSGFALVSLPVGIHRFSLRAERFLVRDEDSLLAADDNGESGHAFTAAYQVRVLGAHRIVLEAVRVVSERPSRETLNLPVKRAETQLQLGLRLKL